MQIQKDSVVTFHYSLSEGGGPEIESSDDGIPMTILCGRRNILQGLEDAMIGEEAGTDLEVTLSPEQAYGLRNEQARRKVSIKHLVSKHKRLNPGTIVKLKTEKGIVDAQVLKAGKFMVELDLNHPFAGKTLVFKIMIKDVREATEEEIAHGHAHAHGGHQA